MWFCGLLISWLSKQTRKEAKESEITKVKGRGKQRKHWSNEETKQTNVQKGNLFPHEDIAVKKLQWWERRQQVTSRQHEKYGQIQNRSVISSTFRISPNCNMPTPSTLRAVIY